MTVFTRFVGVLLLIFFGNFQPVRPAGPGALRPTRTARHSLADEKLWLGSAKSTALCEIGREKGIVFSPDLSEPGNREFYQALGFAYFEDADWRNVLAQIRTYNEDHTGTGIEVLLIQSHGTNGDALKLQDGNKNEAERSYISAGALLENLQDTGVHTCLLAACNAGRLFRPENFHAVRAGEGNRLFEPATLGVINASADFDPNQSNIIAGRRAESHLEVINECHLSEFSPVVRRALIQSSSGKLKETSRIAVPEMLIQLLLHDERLHLVSEGFEVERSSAETDEAYRERLISRFLTFVDSVDAKERQLSAGVK